jgi:excisionase family DNA binding protein
MEQLGNFVTLGDAAKKLSMSANKLRRMVKNGSLTGYQLGKAGEIRISVDEITRLLESSKVQIIYEHGSARGPRVDGTGKSLRAKKG